jgi:hypothetical protein
MNGKDKLITRRRKMKNKDTGRAGQARFFKNGKQVDMSYFMSKDDARLKALALNWNCQYCDYKGNFETIA